MNFTLPANVDCCVFTSDIQDTQQFLQAASDHFAAQYTVLPECIVLHLWRRLSTLPSSGWYTFYHGALPIRLLSPHESPDAFRDIHLPENMAICYRQAAHITDDPMSSQDVLLGVSNAIFTR